MAGGYVTRLLRDMAEARTPATRRKVYDDLVGLVYEELRSCARRQMAFERGVTLQPTSLVHETYARLASYRMSFTDRQHFMRVAAGAMRRCLVDHARARNSRKRGQRLACAMPDDLIPAAATADIDRLLDVDRAMRACLSPNQMEFTELRDFAGFTLDETAQVLGLNIDTAKNRWRVIKALLARELAGWRCQ